MDALSQTNKKLTETSNVIASTVSEQFRDPISWRLVFTSARGIENLHIYFWIFKDLFWSLGYVYPGSTFGCLALLLNVMLFIDEIKKRNSEEIYFLIPMFLWLFGNFWWMMNEFTYIDHKSDRREQGGWIILSGVVLCEIYFICYNFKWFTSIIKNNDYSIDLYNLNGYKSPVSVFSYWRQYEFFHMMCWMIKDVGWNFRLQYLWIIGVIVTLITSVDFLRISFKCKKMAVDFSHYMSQLIWLIANIVWSAGELFMLTSDDTHSIFVTEPMTCRWLASIILLSAFIPIIVLYLIWLPMSYYKIINYNIEMDKCDISYDNV